MTETASDWDAGFGLADGGPDSRPVTWAATEPVTGGVTGRVIPPATGAVTETATGGPAPAGSRRVIYGSVLGDGEPIPAGAWEEAGEEPDGDGGLGAALARLRALIAGSPLLGGAALAAEVADPRPDSWARHWQHVTTHPSMPVGLPAAAGFTAGHLLVTGPLKAAGKAMTATGEALAWTGKRADRAADHFASAAIFIVLATAIAAFVLIAVIQVISHLP